MKATQETALRRSSRPPGGNVRPSPRRVTDLALKQLRGRLLQPLLATTDNPVLLAALRRAAAEAESLAWLTPCPLLVLPTLIEEKAREARFYARRQAGLRDATRDWLSLAE